MQPALAERMNRRANAADIGLEEIKRFTGITILMGVYIFFGRVL
jgi:hypothetical protein